MGSWGLNWLITVVVQDVAVVPRLVRLGPDVAAQSTPALLEVELAVDTSRACVSAVLRTLLDRGARLVLRGPCSVRSVAQQFVSLAAAAERSVYGCDIEKWCNAIVLR